MTQPADWPARLLAAYPPAWRARYGDELEALVEDLRSDGRKPVPMAVDLLCGASAAWFSRRGFTMSRRSQGALFTVLWSWVAFAATAAWFGHDLAIYPTRSRAQQIAVTSPGVPDAYHVLLAAGVVGVAATAVAALAFAIGAARDAHSRGLTRVYLLMAVPPVVAAAWIGGIRLIPRNGSHEGLAVFYLLLGVAGIAASTQAVVTVIRTCEFDDLTWRIGGVAAAAVTAAMVVATGATIAWGLVIHAAMARQGDIGYWLVVTVILAVTSVRALIAMGRTRHDVSGEQAAAQPG